MIEILLSRTRKVKENKIVEEKHEKGTNENTTNLLYLIANYLKENGFVKTFECFTSEAQLQANIEVCDNIDLNVVLQGYINDYSKTFKTEPRLTKVVKSMEDVIPPFKMASKETVQCPVSSTTSGLTSRNNEQGIKEEIESIGDPDSYNSLNESGYLNDWKDLVNTSSKDLYITDLQVNKQWQEINDKGMEKWFLNEAVYCPIQFPELYKTLPVPWKGILLFGPSGSCKTTLIKALANQCQNATFFNVSFTNTDKSLKLIQTVFEFTKYHEFSIICLHKIEQLEREKLSGGDKKCELLKKIDEIYATNEHVFLFATSNSPWDIDPEILSRFEKYIRCDITGSNSFHFYNTSKYIEWKKIYRKNFLEYF